MKLTRTIAVIAGVCAFVAATSLNAATIPAGTTLAVTAVSAFSSKTVAGRSFEGKLTQDVSLNGRVVLKAGSKVFGKVATSRYNPRKNEPLTVELTSVWAVCPCDRPANAGNGSNVAVKTNTFQPGSPTVTARQAQYGHTAGTLMVNPGTLMQFRLLQPVTW